MPDAISVILGELLVILVWAIFVVSKSWMTMREIGLLDRVEPPKELEGANEPQSFPSLDHTPEQDKSS